MSDPLVAYGVTTLRHRVQEQTKILEYHTFLMEQLLTALTLIVTDGKSGDEMTEMSKKAEAISKTILDERPSGL